MSESNNPKIKFEGDSVTLDLGEGKKFTVTRKQYDEIFKLINNPDKKSLEGGGNPSFIVKGGVLDTSNKLLDKHRRERTEPKNRAEEILAIIEESKLRYDSLDIPGSLLEYDPRKSFREAIELAKEKGDEDLLAKTYRTIIAFHEKRKYTYDAALIAIESDDFEKAMELMEVLVDWERSPDYEGALELAGKMGNKHKKKVQTLIKKSKQMKKKAIEEINAETRKKFEGEQQLSEAIYKTKNGSVYQVNQNGIIFKNGEVFVLAGNAYRYLGIVEFKRAWGRFNDRFGYSDHPGLTYAKAWKMLIDSDYIKPEKVPFDQISVHLKRGISILGVNDDAKEAILSSMIEK